MKNRKVRNCIVIICIILLLLLLALGAFLLTNKEKKPVSEGNENETESTLIIKDEDSTVIWEKEEFKDNTTDKKEPTNASQKGGSETLEIILPKDEEDSQPTEGTETYWLEGIW